MCLSDVSGMHRVGVRTATVTQTTHLHTLFLTMLCAQRPLTHTRSALAWNAMTVTIPMLRILTQMLHSQLLCMAAPVWREIMATMPMLSIPIVSRCFM